ncbi:MAG: SusE domain-containing protein [Bacteroidales bacterium]|nr:SusE domain-containing protein [Bacteroidales bacterium]
MRKISIIFITLVGLFGLVSCEKDETRAVISDNPTAPAFTNLTAGAAIVLQKPDADNPISYEFSTADFGFQSSVTYAVQVDLAGNNFADAVNLGTVNNGTSISLLTSDLDNKLLAMERDETDPQPLALEFRVKATVADAVDPVYSAVVSQTITPYYVPVVYPVLHVPGSYQGWNPADETTVIASLKSNGIFEGYVWIGADNAEFKYTEGPNWDNNWGDDGANGSLEKNGANILSGGAAGYYKLNVDINAKTHSFLRTDWGLIGSATPNGWDADQNMTWDAGTSTWTITLALAVGDIKFRANDGWDLNYGDDGNDGKLEGGGANIAIAEAGNYTITLNLSKPIYRYKIVKN